MAKLVEILARELKEWPEGVRHIEQFSTGAFALFSDHFRMNGISSENFEVASNWRSAKVTRAQWEVERDRIATNHQATQEAREIASKGTMTHEEQELAAIACGKRSKEDQALWDKVALTSTLEYMGSEPNLIGSIPVEEFVGWGADVADAFMTERAKRVKGGE